MCMKKSLDKIKVKSTKLMYDAQTNGIRYSVSQHNLSIFSHKTYTVLNQNHITTLVHCRFHE